MTVSFFPYFHNSSELQPLVQLNSLTLHKGKWFKREWACRQLHSRLSPHEGPGPCPAPQLGLKTQSLGGRADGLRPAPICLPNQKDAPQPRLGLGGGLFSVANLWCEDAVWAGHVTRTHSLCGWLPGTAELFTAWTDSPSKEEGGSVPHG